MPIQTNDNQNRFTHRYIDLKLGNLCNLRVEYAMLGVAVWVDDFKQADTKSFWGKQNYDFKWYENEEYWQQLETVLPTLTKLIYMAVNFNQNNNLNF